MKARELIRMLRGLEEYELKGCAITYEILTDLDAEPVRHGHWIKSQGGIKCSACGHFPLNRIIFRGEKIWEIDADNELCYCPYCGAKMDEVKK